MNTRKGLFREQRGLTLLELVVVLSILAVVAGIVAPAVGGKTTQSRASTMVSDIQGTQTAVDNYAGDAPANSDKSAQLPLKNGTLPTSSDFHATVTSFKHADGTTSTLYVKPILFASTFIATEGGGTKKFIPNYIKTAPKHSADTVDNLGKNPSLVVSFTGGTITFTGGKDYSATGDGTTPASLTTVWVIDQDGIVRVLLDPSAY